MTVTTRPDRLREILDTVVASIEEDGVDGTALAVFRTPVPAYAPYAA